MARARACGLYVEAVINAPQQRGSLAQVRVILSAVHRISRRSVDVRRQGRFLDVRMVTPEPAHNLAAAERLIQLADAFLEHRPYGHRPILRARVTSRIRVYVRGVG